MSEKETRRLEQPVKMPAATEYRNSMGSNV